MRPVTSGRTGFRSGGALTVWTNSWLRGAVSYDAAVTALQDAGVRAVRGLAEHSGEAPVGWALAAIRSAAGGPLRLVLPVAGDIRGVPQVPGLAAVAVEMGQLVASSGFALVPDGDPRVQGQWQAWTMEPATPVPATPGELQTIAQAAGALRLAVLEATDALAALDVARWNPGVESLRRREQRLSLPPDHEPSAAALATRCAQLAAILELAGADAPGGAVNGYGAGQRDAVLRRLSLAVREGLMTAFSAVPAGRSVQA